MGAVHAGQESGPGRLQRDRRRPGQTHGRPEGRHLAPVAISGDGVGRRRRLFSVQTPFDGRPGVELKTSCAQL